MNFEMFIGKQYMMGMLATHKRSLKCRKQKLMNLKS